MLSWRFKSLTFLQLKDFADTEKNETTTEEVERVYGILKEMYQEVDCKYP